MYTNLCVNFLFALGQILRNVIVELYGKFSFLRDGQITFQSDYSILFCESLSRIKISFSISANWETNKLRCWMRSQFHFERIFNCRYLFWVYKMFHWTKIKKELLAATTWLSEVIIAATRCVFLLVDLIKTEKSASSSIFLLVPCHFHTPQLIHFLCLIWVKLSMESL